MLGDKSTPTVHFSPSIPPIALRSPAGKLVAGPGAKGLPYPGRLPSRILIRCLPGIRVGFRYS
jgi:hypothetical protein